jgi:hypothetical protein
VPRTSKRCIQATYCSSLQTMARVRALTAVRDHSAAQAFAYGYAAVSGAIDNPFKLTEESASPVVTLRYHAHSLWALAAKTPAVGFRRNWYQINRYLDYHAWMKGREWLYWPDETLGVPGKSVPGCPPSLVLLANGMVLDTDTRNCGQFDFHTGRRNMFPGVTVSPSVVAFYPKGERATPFELAWWSVQAAKEAERSFESERQKRRVLVPNHRSLQATFAGLERGTLEEK